MSFKKLKPIQGGVQGCLNCGYVYSVAPMDMDIAVGFGEATVTKNGVVIYDEMEVCLDNYDVVWDVEMAEREAMKDPDNDWRINLNAPLSGRIYQRQGECLWVLVEKNQGFA